MVGGINSQRNEEMLSDAKRATFEIAEKMYEKMIEMAKKGKNVRTEATRDTSYINILKLQEKGAIEILENEESTFGRSDIEMNNVIIKPNVEKLEEELRSVKKILEKLREQERLKTVERKNPEDVDFDDI